MSADPLRVACIGMGWWSDVLADAIQRSGKLEIRSCYTRSDEKRKNFAAKYRCRPAASYEALLADAEIEAIINTTPNDVHLATTCCCRSRRQARLSGQADRQQHLGRPRHHRGLPQGRRGAGARLSAAAREPFPLCQAADRSRPVRQARQRRGEHQPRSSRQGRSNLVALPGRGHAGRRDAADRNPLYRRARLPDRADPCGARAVGATGAARRQS